MKKNNYLGLAVGFLLSITTFVSCGSDDGKSNPENNNSGSSQNYPSQKTADCDEVGNIKISEVNFPDPVFRAYLLEEYGADGVLTNAEIDNITRFDFYNKNIKSLEGIEFFPMLTWLNCGSNQLNSLDVSKNTKLIELGCFSNQLTSLDISKNAVLTVLGCDFNQLTSLDLSKNTTLTDLNCSYNQLTSLDLSNNMALTELRCFSNQLTSLDVLKNRALTYLDCRLNQLTSLDLSNNTVLEYLDCDPSVEVLRINNTISSADISYKANVSGSILDVCDVLVKYYDENEQEQSEKANDNWSKTFTVKKFPAKLGISISLKRKNGVPAIESSYTIEVSPIVNYTGIKVDGSKTNPCTSTVKTTSIIPVDKLDHFIEGLSFSIIHNLQLTDDKTNLNFN